MSWQPPPPPPRPGAGGPGPGAAVQPAAPVRQTYYQILQVDSNAHQTIIRYAYRFLAAMFHPDNGETGDAEKFKVISEAWRTLQDSAKRAAYDASVGLQAATAPGGAMAGAQQTRAGMPNIPKAGLAWNEVELRLAILQVLMEARRKKPQTGGASARMLMDCLNVELGEIEYVLWYLREKNFIMRTEAAFMITIQGVDYLVDTLSKTQPMDAGANSRSSTVASSINLPAPLS
jgi:curved DNA-binding protein CbpA